MKSARACSQPCVFYMFLCVFEWVFFCCWFVCNMLFNSSLTINSSLFDVLSCSFTHFAAFVECRQRMRDTKTHRMMVCFNYAVNYAFYFKRFRTFYWTIICWCWCWIKVVCNEWWYYLLWMRCVSFWVNWIMNHESVENRFETLSLDLLTLCIDLMVAFCSI